MGAGSRGLAQTTEKPPEVWNQDVRKEDIAAFVKKIQGNQGIASETRGSLLETAQKAQETLEKSIEWVGKTREFRQAEKGAPQALEIIHADLKKEKVYVAPDVSSGTLTRHQQFLEKTEAEQKLGKERLVELEKEIIQLTARRSELPRLAADAGSRLESLYQSGNDVKADEGNADQKLVMGFFLNAQKRLAGAEVAALEAELASFEKRLEVSKARRELLTRKLTEIDSVVKRLQQLVAETRSREAEEEARKAQDALQSIAASMPAVRALAEENARFAEKRRNLLPRMDAATREMASATKLLEKTKEEFRSVRERVNVIGYSDAIGLLLRVRRSELPNPKEFSAAISKRKRIISHIQLQMLEMSELQNTIPDPQVYLQDSMEVLNASYTVEQKEFIRSSIRDLLESRKSMVTTLTEEYKRHFNVLVDLDSMQIQLVGTLQEYSGFMDERILWIRSQQSLRIDEFTRIFRGVLWLFQPMRWWNSMKSVYESFLDSFVLWAFFFAVPIALLVFKRRALAFLPDYAEKVKNFETDSLFYTFEALIITVLFSGVWPLMLLLVGNLCSSVNDADLFTKSIGAAFMQLALPLWVLRAFWLTFNDAGLAGAHFGWRPLELHRPIRRRLALLLAGAIPLQFFLTILSWHQTDPATEALRRLIFILQMMWLVIVFHPFFGPGGEFFRSMATIFARKFVYKARYFIYFLTVLMPMGFLVATGFGYLYTSQELFRRTTYSVALILAVLLFHALVYRILRRYVAIATAAAAQEAKAAAESAETPGEAAREGLVAAHEEVDWLVLATQARRLLFGVSIIFLLAGLWAIWEEILPAIRILNHVNLWTTDVVVTETITNANGTTSKVLVNKEVQITLMSLVLSVGTLFLSVWGSRVLPGVLELSVLQRFALDGGARFAIRTLTGYAISIVGVVSAFHLMGLGWEKVQWLAAAISVGLGFGLQEIFANFISGLIILFERPIRVGDVVTVGDVSGTVTKVEIRATTIQTWDRKELIVPNKEFITGRVVNWSLSDQTLRVTFKVGIDYKANPDQVRKLLLEVANNQPLALKDPSPQALMTEFGDSALLFELRIYIPNLDNYTDFYHSVNADIYKKLQENGITIPFPQRDVHLIPPTAVGKAR
jgi:potassium efflux system protein